MNDIEVLERLLEEGFSAMCPLEAQAIEKLLKRNKDLEKGFNNSAENEVKLTRENTSLKFRIKDLEIKNRAIKNENNAYAQRMISLDNELQCEKEHSKYEWIRQNCLPIELVNKLYIPKSLIKEKIEEYKAKTDCRYCNNSCDSYAVCKVLEALLKENR